MAQTDPPEVVTVPDAALRRCFEASLGLCAGASIPATELAAPTVLEATDAVSEYPVTVTNVEEEGTVDLSPTPPRVDEALTATLSDPDGSLSATD